MRIRGPHMTYDIRVPDFAHASFGDYLFDASRSGPFHVNRQEYENQLTIRSFALIIQSIRYSIFKIFSFLSIHSHDRTSSITRVLHTAAWGYFTRSLSGHFIRSQKVVMEEIMTEFNDSLQEFWTSSNGAVGTSFFARRSSCLLILQKCFDSLEHDVRLMVCFDFLF